MLVFTCLIGSSGEKTTVDGGKCLQRNDDYTLLTKFYKRHEYGRSTNTIEKTPEKARKEMSVKHCIQ